MNCFGFNKIFYWKKVWLTRIRAQHFLKSFTPNYRWNNSRLKNVYIVWYGVDILFFWKGRFYSLFHTYAMHTVYVYIYYLRTVFSSCSIIHCYVDTMARMYVRNRIFFMWKMCHIREIYMRQKYLFIVLLRIYKKKAIMNC